MTRYRINEIKTETDVPMSTLPSVIAGKLGIREDDICRWEIRRKSVDSRKKPHIQFVYTVDFDTERKIKNVCFYKNRNVGTNRVLHRQGTFLVRYFYFFG